MYLTLFQAGYHVVIVNHINEVRAEGAPYIARVYPNSENYCHLLTNCLKLQLVLRLLDLMQQQLHSWLRKQ
jgi:hypothetical protein